MEDFDSINVSAQTDKKNILKRVLVFDLDDCIYPKSSGIKVCVHKNITRILYNIIDERRKKNLSIPEDVENYPEFNFEVYENLAYKLYLAHGTTLNGLIKLGYIEEPETPSDDDSDPLIQYNHAAQNFSFEEVNLTENDPELISLFEKLRKTHNLKTSDDANVDQGLIVLLTNADRKHAVKVLGYLGILKYFDICVHFEELRMKGKPHPHAYKFVEQRCQEFIDAHNSNLSDGGDKAPHIDPKLTNFVFFDDNLLNVRAAVDLNWKGVWVAENLRPGEKIPPLAKHEKDLEADLEPNGGKIKVIRSILDIPEICPELL